MINNLLFCFVQVVTAKPWWLCRLLQWRKTWENLCAVWILRNVFEPLNWVRQADKWFKQEMRYAHRNKAHKLESLSSFSMNCSWYKPGILPLASESFVGIQCKVIVVGMMHEVLLSYLKLFCDMSDHIICTLSFALCMRFIFTIFKHKSSLTYKNTFYRNLCSKFNILEVISLTLCLSFHLWKIKNLICW